MGYTLQKAAQLALDVQNASNLSGTVNFLNNVLQETIWPEARRIGQGTNWVNQHPIVTVLLDKLSSLNGSQCLCDSSNRIQQAFDAVEALAKGQEPKAA